MRRNLGFTDWFNALDSAALAAPADEGVSFANLISQAPALFKDLYIAKETGDLQRRLLEENLERARRGLPPLDASAYAPHTVAVGLTPQTQRTAAMGTALLAAAAALGVGALVMSSRRRR